MSFPLQEDIQFSDTNGDGMNGLSDVTAISTNYNETHDNVVFNPFAVSGVSGNGGIYLSPRNSVI